MARYLVATHTATVTRDWLCGHCEAFGLVSVEAEGEAEKRVWFSRDAAADVAHDRAAEALERDADRVVSLVRCPRCRERARGAVTATLWHGLGDLWTAILAAAFGAVIGLYSLESTPLAIVLAVVAAIVMLALGKERRRWRAAGRAHLQVSRAQRSSRSPIVVERPSHAHPFRVSPAPPPVAVVQPVLATHVPAVVNGDSAAPSFLT